MKRGEHLVCILSLGRINQISTLGRGVQVLGSLPHVTQRDPESASLILSQCVAPAQLWLGKQTRTGGGCSCHCSAGPAVLLLSSTTAPSAAPSLLPSFPAVALLSKTVATWVVVGWSLVKMP